MQPAEIERRTVSKVMWRLIPFMMLLYVFNYLDRANINVAKLKMIPELDLDDNIYGAGVAVFFVGYFIFEVPSNVMLERVGARRWIARIMISWGLISSLFIFVKGKWSFYALRFLLGSAEAGFFPGMVLYLTYWIPARQRARIGAIFMTSIAISGIIGNPLNGWIVEKANGFAGLSGWRWIFLVDGIPTILLGCAVLFIFTDRPESAAWLSPEERGWLSARMNDERLRTQSEHGRRNLMDALRSGRVWLLSLIFTALVLGGFSIHYWIASVIEERYPREWIGAGMTTVPESIVGRLSAIPFFGAIIGMVLIGRIADGVKDKRNVVAVCMFMSCVGLLGVSLTHDLISAIAFFTLAAVANLGALAPFWTLPPLFLTGTAAAAGLAFINSWGNLGAGFGGNRLMGFLKTRYNTYAYGLWINAGALLIGALLVLLLPIRTRPKSTALIPSESGASAIED
ncbi:MAG TPA: MFS transporter [Planctomycetota bacterium]|nr:MFS transporter [Planctomycetota bacterium]